MLLSRSLICRTVGADILGPTFEKSYISEIIMNIKESYSRLRFLPLYLLFLLFLTATPARSELLTGKVVNVADGDTITILDTNKTQHKIRLYGIDSPEKAQDFGNAAKKYTSSLTAGKTAEVISYDTDRYGRTVGVVMVNGVNVNQSLINAGYAWQYRAYCKESFCDGWLGLEQEARNSKLGLWVDPNPVAPWEWRKDKRNGNVANSSVSTSASVGEYHGNVKSHVFHSPGCQHYNCKNCIEMFKSVEEAVNAGYRRHDQCVKQ